MNTPRGLSLALAGLVVWTAGCTSYKEIRIDQIPEHDEVRITTTTSERYLLERPGVYGDTLRGPALKPRIPLDQIEKLEVGYTDPAKTAGFVVEMLVAATVLIGGAVCAWNECELGPQL